MTEEQNPEKKKFWKKPFIVLFGAIGLIASTSTVIAIVWDFVEPDTAQQDQAMKLAEIDRKLTENQEDTHLVNQVSRRVTELGDEYQRIQAGLKDIRRLEKSLAAAPRAVILTPDHQKLAEAGRAKEIEELLSLLEKTEKMARRFVESVEADETLGKVLSTDSETARTKSRADEQARQVREKLLAELKTIRDKYEKTSAQ